MPSCLDVGKLQERLTQPPHPFQPTPPPPSQEFLTGAWPNIRI